MADFITRVLKWLAALVTAYAVLFIFGFFLIIMIGVAFQPTPVQVKEDSILVMDLGFNLSDKPQDEDPAALIGAALGGNLIQSVSLKQALDGLEDAADDENIKALLITGNLISDGYGGSFAALQELRQAIQRFAESKPVYARTYADSLRDYYLKSAADEVISDPNSFLDFRGLRSERLYMGEAFEKIGVEVQVVAFEEYKSAYDTFRQGAMGEDDKEQLKELLFDIWNTLLADIAESRGVEAAVFDDVAAKDLAIYGDELTGYKFTDKQMNQDEFIDYMTSKSSYDSVDENFEQFDFIDYTLLNGQLENPFAMLEGNDKLAVVYIEGTLLDGEGTDGGFIGANSLSKHFRELRKNDSVKAVVIRINSPGGSATASGKVTRDIQLLNDEKPVIVSMGGMAASAGYMMAAPSDYIFSEASTVTGSIGVAMMLPNIEQLSEKLAINFDGVETHPFAGTLSLGRRKTDEEMQQIRGLGEAFYKEFLSVVAEGRDMSVEEIRKVAGGRVWSGKSALEIGLVDELGGLMDAVKRAADTAGIGDDYDIIERPRPLSFEEKLEEILVGAGLADPLPRSEIRTLFRDVEQEVTRLSMLNDPYGLYAVLPYSLKIK
ncbi:MAG: signal peptide peptidase SppA [Puniceicoccaceae bacterium]